MTTKQLIEELQKMPQDTEVMTWASLPEEHGYTKKVKLIEKQVGKKAITQYIDEPRKGDRIWDMHDVSKFQKDYPEWKYKYSLQDIIKNLCQSWSLII